MEGLLERNFGLGTGRDDLWGDAWMTAMARYFFLGWQLTPIEAPTLLIRASEPMPGWDANADWKPWWRYGHTAADVPGDHFTMMEEYAGETVDAIRRWIAAGYR